MAASGLLRERDLRALTAVIEDGLRDDPGPAMPWAVLDRLYQLIPSDTVEFDEVDLHGHRSLAGQGTFDDGGRYVELPHHSDGDARFWALLEEFLPYSYPRRTGDLASVVRWSDFYTGSELRNSAFYAEYLTYHSVPKYCVVVPLPTEQGRTRQVMFCRSTETSASGTDSSSNCCGRTCTRSTSTPNAAAAASPT